MERVVAKVIEVTYENQDGWHDTEYMETLLIGIPNTTEQRDDIFAWKITCGKSAEERRRLSEFE